MVETGMHDMEPATKCGKVIKVKSLRSSEEVRQERWREKQASRARALQARREMLLQAVEQAVTLPEPRGEMPSESEEVTTEVSAKTMHEKTAVKDWMQGKVGRLTEKMEGVLCSMSMLIEKARILVLETD